MAKQNLKIRTRMWIGFGAILSMVILLGGVAIWHSGMIWNNTYYMYHHPFKVNVAVREIQTNVMAMQRSMKNVLLSENQDELNEAVHNINLNEAEAYRWFDTISAYYLGRRTSIDTALMTFRDWKPDRDETIRLTQGGMKDQAVSRSKTTGEHHVMLIMGKINILKNFAINRAADFYRTAEQGKDQLYVRFWIVILLIMVCSVVVFVFIMRGITIPLRSLISSVAKYKEGHYHVRSRFASTSEMGMLATAMNELAEKVQFDINSKNGTLEIADAMLSTDDLPVFCRLVLEKLMYKTRSDLGAFYFLNEDTGMYDPYFSCGFREDKLTSFAAGSNEGEFGAMLLGKKMTRMSQIPDDTIFIYSTVAGAMKPKDIITIPVLRRNTVVAVVSLASIATYSDEALEIIRQSEKNINMSVNAMLAFQQIREYTSSIDKQNETLNRQAMELQMQTDELIEQNTELEVQKQQINEANRLKSQFLSSMSHELRTPLNSVIALSGVLNKRLKGQIAEEEYSYLEIIERNGKNLLTLINDILDLSRIEAGKSGIQYSTFSLKEIVEHIVSSLQVQIMDKNNEVKNLLGDDLPMITSDSDKCHHILQNIIGNAVKFTESGIVEITAVVSGTDMKVAVRDTGIGIPKDQLPFIFDEFRQVDGTTSKQFGGTGLGLAIADKYARQLNATITVISEPGEGSVFTVVLPLSASSGFVHAAGQPGLSEKYQSQAVQPDMHKADASMKTILIVEDSEPAIVQLSWILREQGYRLMIARNGFEALAAVRETIPDAIILDLMMPGMDGFEVLENIRGTNATATIPVLVLTAMYLQPSELKRLTQNHIHQLVQKGDVNKHELLAIIQRMTYSPDGAKADSFKDQDKRVKIAGPASILVIDDNADNGTTIKVLLQDKHAVTNVTNGPDGVQTARTLKPDLILLDVSLPGMDGFMVFDEIRKDPALGHIPVIAVTAKAMKGDREHILEYGFNAYISKPIDLAEFEETIRQWVS